MEKLFKTRLISFGYSFLTFALVVGGGFVFSDGFKEWIFSNFGTSAWTSLFFLLSQEVVKHLRNVAKLGKLGAQEDDIILI